MEARTGPVEPTKEKMETEVPDWVGPVFEKFKAEVCAEVTARVAYSVKLMLNQNLEDVKAVLKSQITLPPAKLHRGKNEKKARKELAEGEQKLNIVGNDGLLPEVAKQLENYSCKSSRGSPTLTESSCDENEDSIEHAKSSQHTEFPSFSMVPSKCEEEGGKEQTEQTSNECEPCVAEASTEVADMEKPTSISLQEEPNFSVGSAAENVTVLEPQIETQQNEEACVASNSNLEDESNSSVVVQKDILSQYGRQRAASYSSTSSEFEIVPLTAAITDSQHSYSSAETRALSLSFSEDDSDTEDYVNIQKLLRGSLGAANLNNSSSTVPGVFTELDQARSALQRIMQLEQTPADCVVMNELQTSTMTVVGATAEEEVEPVRGFDAADGQNISGQQEDPSTAVTDLERVASVVERNFPGTVKAEDLASCQNSIDQDEESARAVTALESVTAASPPAKVFTETLFQQVDEFEKTLKPKEDLGSISLQHETKSQELEKPKSELPWLPSPYEFNHHSQLSRTLNQHGEAVGQNPFLSDNIFTAEPEWPSRQTRASPRRNPVAVNPPRPYDFLSSSVPPVAAANRPSQRRVEVLEPLYPTDVPTETLWEDALTRAAQVYNTAKSAVGEISDTFSQVKQQAVFQLQTTRRDPSKDSAAEPRNRIPRRGRPLLGPRDPEELQYLEEMGFHNRQLNTRLLKQHNNDLETVIATLLELQDGW